MTNVKEYIWQRKLILLGVTVLLLIFDQIQPEIFRDVAVFYLGANSVQHIADGLKAKKETKDESKC